MSNVEDPQTNLDRIEAIKIHKIKFYQVLEAELLEDALTVPNVVKKILTAQYPWPNIDTPLGLQSTVIPVEAWTRLKSPKELFEAVGQNFDGVDLEDELDVDEPPDIFTEYPATHWDYCSSSFDQ